MRTASLRCEKTTQENGLAQAVRESWITPVCKFSSSHGIVCVHSRFLMHRPAACHEGHVSSCATEQRGCLRPVDHHHSLSPKQPVIIMW
jgi:hypothetical protein